MILNMHKPRLNNVIRNFHNTSLDFIISNVDEIEVLSCGGQLIGSGINLFVRAYPLSCRLNKTQPAGYCFT